MVKIIACILVAFCYLHGVASYNPYAFASQFQGSANPDSYAAMGDIDWVKRSPSRSWLSPSVWAYSSMADADWGWKKRTDHSYDPVASALFYDPKRTYPKSFRSRQPYMQARPGHDQPAPYQAYARFEPIARPQTRKLGDRQYGYASMADMDWGWKKRAQWPAWLDLEADEEDSDVEKRNLASLAKSNLYPADHKLYAYGKRFTEDDEDEDLNEEKRHIASIARAGRSGVSSLARNGMLRGSP